MSKIKQSIAIQRQIPEHVRETYPVFVEFVKLYYDFLEQSQSQELEKIRDIDTTLEEFIDRFKSELTKNLPVDLAADKRLLLKHIREFYLSRGSEASYKFLFRTLFGKEATLFYPSTQILKASDGKWKQDISIYVQLDTASLAQTADMSDADITGLAGKFFIIVSGNKSIKTYAEQVLRYDATTFEIFIQRDYAGDIQVGATVEYNDETYGRIVGHVVPCPAKISIFKSGAGFKVGQLFKLKTSIGDGCVVKITKVNNDGAIQAVQPIRFGLDYKTTFYSYLSSKSIIAPEYVHPIHLVSGTNENPATPPGYTPGDPAYNEAHGGFVDYGFASRQDYFYYDTDIPVGAAENRADRFFADASYVGDVVQQFYTDPGDKIIDEDIAIIQIDLGPVARYPGYYLNADGFVSDESYLHDGRYYQAFSYVIKVEEELRKYADIIKAIVHPAGMKAFSEYTISNEIEVSAVQPLLRQVLQLVDPVYGVDDRGYNWDEYVATTNAFGELEYIPGATANKVYARQGRSAQFATKNIALAVENVEKILYNYEKIIPAVENFILPEELYSNSLSKIASDEITEYLESMANMITRQLKEDVNHNEIISNFISTTKDDIQYIVDLYNPKVEKPFTDTLDSPIDVEYTSPIKNLSEDIYYDELKNLDSAKALIDSYDVIELLSNAIHKQGDGFNEISTPIDDVPISHVQKVLQDVVDNTGDLLTTSVLQMIENFVPVFEQNGKLTERSISDLTSLLEEVTVQRVKLYEEYLESIDQFSLARFKGLDDAIEIVEQFIESFYDKVMIETINIIEEKNTSFVKDTFIENMSIGELYSLLNSRIYDEVIDQITETYLNNLEKIIADNVDVVEYRSAALTRGTKADNVSVAASGRIYNPNIMYANATQVYFMPSADYQSALTSIS